MFTGIVEELGRVRALTRSADAARLTVDASTVLADVRHGGSIAVNGCCLTVVEVDGAGFTADVMAETLAKTSLGSLGPGGQVNLERAVPLSGRLDGHLVQGHVDGTGRVVSRTPGERWEVVVISVPAELARYIAVKGSIAVDGVSLTVVDIGEQDGMAWFSVSLIPETLARTTLGRAQPADVVNLEVDVLAKYVERLLGGAVGPR